jgi:hypothetical protein
LKRDNLIEARTKAIPKNSKHGGAGRGRKTRAYHSWDAMIQRCTNPKTKAFKDYGGRGITICERWQHSFKNFLADMGEPPVGQTLDRFPDNDGNYEPTNCRWATRKQQNNNQRPRRRSLVCDALIG